MVDSTLILQDYHRSEEREVNHHGRTRTPGGTEKKDDKDEDTPDTIGLGNQARLSQI